MTAIKALDPHIRLFGSVNDAMFNSFIEQLNKARELPQGQAIVVELTTTGGDAETGRRIASDIALCRRLEDREFVFIGKTVVYSAGITIMAAFEAKQRYLTQDTELLIHERRLSKTVELSGALRANKASLRDEMAALDSGERLECAGFEQLVRGTPLSADDVLEKVMHADWYLPAAEAVKIGLVAGTV